MQEKTIGILGGMGPEATIDLFRCIVEETHASCDEDHIHILVDCNPKMPSRQDAILNGGPSPVPAMVETAKNLQRAGADCIILGANTAHYFFDSVASQVPVPFLHIIDEAVKDLLRQVPHGKKAGVLATSAAMKVGLYQKSCEKFGIQVLPVSPQLQESIHNAIFDFKYHGLTPQNQGAMVKAAETLISQGADALIFGCTEIPLILAGCSFSVPAIDPNRSIARAAVAFAKGTGQEDRF